MNNQAFFDIHDNELIVSYLHLPITRDRQFWEKSVIELYQFVLSRIEREQIKLTKGQLEYLVLKMCVENGSLNLYMPFKKNTINTYVLDYRSWLSMKHKGRANKQERQEAFVGHFNAVLKDEVKADSKVKSPWGHGSNSKWHHLLIPVVDSLLDSFTLIAHTLDESEVWDCIVIILQEMGNVCGGRSIYLPSNGKLRTAIRKSLIFDEFNGANIGELAQKYRVSPQYVYEAVRKQRKYRLKLVS